MYLIDFITPEEMYSFVTKEPWLYRGDLIEMRYVQDCSDVTPEFVFHAALWTQFHNITPRGHFQ